MPRPCPGANCCEGGGEPHPCGGCGNWEVPATLAFQRGGESPPRPNNCGQYYVFGVNNPPFTLVDLRDTTIALDRVPGLYRWARQEVFGADEVRVDTTVAINTTVTPCVLTLAIRWRGQTGNATCDDTTTTYSLTPVADPYCLAEPIPIYRTSFTAANLIGTIVP